MDPKGIAKVSRDDRQRLYQEALRYCKTPADFGAVEGMDDAALFVFVGHYRDLERESRGERRQGRWVKARLSLDPAQVVRLAPMPGQDRSHAVTDAPAPKTDGHRRRWRLVWSRIKKRKEQMDEKELLAWYNRLYPRNATTAKTLSKIIRAGDAGALEPAKPK